MSAPRRPKPVTAAPPPTFSPRAKIAARAAAPVACAALLAACGGAPEGPRALDVDLGAPSVGLAPVAADRVCVTAGTVEAVAEAAIRIEDEGVRAVVASDASRAVEVAFRHPGPSRGVAPLASGELRRQIGLKLRAQDTCNVVYVMWHLEPEPGVFVSVKHNPGASTHAECGAAGYVQVSPSEASAPPPPIRRGELHTLRADLDGRALVVRADGEVVWRGELPEVALTFDGPAGLRTDNAAFDLELRVPRAAGGDAACVEGRPAPAAWAGGAG